MNYKLVLIITGLISFCLAQSSENYVIKNAVFSGAGSRSQSDSYILTDAIGQPLPVGQFTSDNYSLSTGFFYNSETATDIDDEEPLIPKQFKLENNFPNPFNPTTTIEYSIPEDSDVTISIYDLNGQLIQSLVDDNKTAGVHKTIWNATNISSGIYFYKIRADHFTAVKKCILIK